MNLTEIFHQIAQKSGWEFVLDGESVPLQEVFSLSGWMPALAKRADRLCLFCLGYGIGVIFVDDSSATLGISMQFDSITPDMLRIFYIYDVLMELVTLSDEPNQLSLNELMYDC